MRRAASPGLRQLDRRFVALAILYALVVLAVGQRPASNLPKLDFGLAGIRVDKYAHFAMYALLSGLIWRAQVPRSPRLPSATKWPAFWCIGLTACVGCIDELWQSVANRGRSGDVLDLVADTLGACAAVGWAMWFRRRI